MNNKTNYFKLAKIPSYLTAGCFLCIHVVMLFLFYRYQVMPMFYFNIGSIVFYVAMLVLIRFDQLFLYVLLTFAEIVVHMVLAVFYVGWNSGFQITLIGLVIMGFYAEYVARILERQYVPGILMGILVFVLYEASYLMTQWMPAQYPLPDKVSFGLQLAWGAVVFIIDIVCLQFFVLQTFRSEKTLEKQVTHDQLTGLLTRYYMDDYLYRLMREEDKDQYWIAMIDIDDFKKVNDTYGHNCGDYVLRATADIFCNNTSDVQVCRWGGEEFLLVGRIKASIEEEIGKLEELRKTVENYPYQYEDQSMNLTITIGVADYQNDASVREWVERADKNLYHGKTHGKNMVV